MWPNVGTSAVLTLIDGFLLYRILQCVHRHRDVHRATIGNDPIFQSLDQHAEVVKDAETVMMSTMSHDNRQYSWLKLNWANGDGSSTGMVACLIDQND